MRYLCVVCVCIDDEVDVVGAEAIALGAVTVCRSPDESESDRAVFFEACDKRRLLRADLKGNALDCGRCLRCRILANHSGVLPPRAAPRLFGGRHGFDCVTANMTKTGN